MYKVTLDNYKGDGDVCGNYSTVSSYRRKEMRNQMTRLQLNLVVQSNTGGNERSAVAFLSVSVSISVASV